MDRCQARVFEMDLVAHCGWIGAGQFLYTLSMVDVATGWVVCAGLRDKRSEAVFHAPPRLHVGGERIHVATATRPGTYGGGVQAFTGSSVASGYRATAKATRDSRFFQLPSSELARLLGDWSPVAKQFLDGYLQRLEGIEAAVRQRERRFRWDALQPDWRAR